MAEARRTIDLLWFPQARERKRGRRPALSVPRVVEAGIALADAEGLEAVTMRRVAQELGVVPMTLYTYVPDKATLLELMLDRLYLEMPRSRTPAEQPAHVTAEPEQAAHVTAEPEPAARVTAEPESAAHVTAQPGPAPPFAAQSGAWRERLAAIAEENRALYAAHPWAATLPASRPPLGPGLMAKYEHELAAFAGCGLDDVETDSALTYLIGFVQAAARAAAETRAVAATSGTSDYQWWQERGPVFELVFDRHAYPNATRIGAAAGAALGAAFNPQHAYEFGLQRVLDGLGVLIAARARVAGSDRHR